MVFVPVATAAAAMSDANVERLRHFAVQTFKAGVYASASDKDFEQFKSLSEQQELQKEVDEELKTDRDPTNASQTAAVRISDTQIVPLPTCQETAHRPPVLARDRKENLRPAQLLQIDAVKARQRMERNLVGIERIDQPDHALLIGGLELNDHRGAARVQRCPPKK